MQTYPEEILSRVLVPIGGSSRQHYELLHLPFNKEDREVTVNLVLVAQITELKLLVAVPEAAWSRTVGERMLPRNALQKAILVDVNGAFLSDPETELVGESVQLWVGTLDLKLAKRLQVGAHLSPEADVYRSVEGGEIVMPYGPALAEVAEDHFVFLSATSETGAETAELKLAAEVESRFGKIETAIGSLQDFIETQFAAQARPLPPRGISPSRDLPQETVKPAELRGGREKAPATRKGPRQSGGDYGSLDPSVVAEALKAGVPDEQLATLAGLLKKTSKMKDVPGKAPSRKRNVLSETEEEDEEQEEGRAEEEEEYAADPGVNTMERALLQLTRIAGSLAKGSKMTDRKGLEQILEFHEGSDSTSSSSSRSKAAAYQRLRNALTEKPAMLVKALETAMEEDFAMLRTAPGSAGREVSTRGWLESRSKLQYYPNTIRFGWILAGVHDAMRRECHQEARARVLLAIAALDQTSLDSGAWSLGQEILLEPGPPLSSFVGRRLPEPWEQPITRLIDDRWAEILMWRLKDRDSFVEARKRLQITRGVVPKDPAPAPSPKPTPKPKSGKKGEKGGGRGAAPGEELTPQS